MQRLSVPLIGNILTLSLATVAMTLTSAYSATAGTLGLNFTKLQGLTGGSSGTTGVYRADLSNLGFDMISAISMEQRVHLGNLAVLISMPSKLATSWLTMPQTPKTYQG